MVTPAERHDKRFPTNLRVYLVGERRSLSATLTDLSLGGAFIEGVRLELGEHITVVFQDLRSALSVAAQVTHSSAAGSGIRFSPGEELKRLQSLFTWIRPSWRGPSA